jgi:predicted nucleic acid-binding Zn ribbon protein
MNMPRTHDNDDDLPEGVYHDDDWPTIRCPYCREEIAEESVQCPKCGEYLSREDMPSEPKSRFWIGMMAIAILCAIIWILALAG